MEIAKENDVKETATIRRYYREGRAEMLGAYAVFASRIKAFLDGRGADDSDPQELDLALATISACCEFGACDEAMLRVIYERGKPAPCK